MRTHHFLIPILALVQVSIWCPSAQGQWALGFEVGSDRFWGSSIEIADPHRSFRPYRPTTVGMGLELRRHRLGAALHLRYAGASIALEGDDAAVVVKGVFSHYQASPELVYRIATLGSTNQLRLHAGPVFELWSVEGEESQLRAGLQGAVSIRIPFGGRLAGLLTAGAAVTASPLTQEQLLNGYKCRALWRRSVAGGIEYRL
ncbi:MAG TPA: hypothetical protein VIV15_12545 [Anaerolineales bacterium]